MLRILLVDTPENLRFLRRLLDRHRVAAVSTVKDALYLLRTEPAPDVVLAEEGLADGSGTEFLSQVRFWAPSARRYLVSRGELTRKPSLDGHLDRDGDEFLEFLKELSS